MICAGIDAGSRAIKVVVLNPDTMEILAAAGRPQGVQQERLAMELLEQVLAEQKLPRSAVRMLIATGYGYEADVRAAQAEISGRLLPAVRDIRRLG